MYLKQWNRKIDKANNYGWIVHFGCDHSLCCKQMTAVEQTGHLDLRHPHPHPRLPPPPTDEGSKRWRLHVCELHLKDEHHIYAPHPGNLAPYFTLFIWRRRKERKKTAESSEHYGCERWRKRDRRGLPPRYPLRWKRTAPCCWCSVSACCRPRTDSAREARSCPPSLSSEQDSAPAVVSNIHKAHPSGGE